MQIGTAEEALQLARHGKILTQETEEGEGVPTRAVFLKGWKGARGWATPSAKSGLVYTPR